MQLIAVADGPIDDALVEAMAGAARAVAPVEEVARFAATGHEGVRIRCAGADDRATRLALRLAVDGAIGDRGIDLAVRASDAPPPALVVMDMDSTILRIEVIDELARRRGVGAAVAAITERAMRGELDFEASLRTRVRELAGLPVTELADLAAALPLSPGVAALVDALCARGVVMAIASGGFTFAADVLRNDLGFAHAFANTLGVADGVLTGEVLGAVVTAERKAAVVDELRARYDLDAAHVIAIGDGANDRAMLAAAGLGVAYRPKPALAAVADGVIAHGGLDRLLAFIA